MLKFSTEMTPSELHSAIIRDPLIVTPETTVMGAIAQMSRLRGICSTTKITDGQLDELDLDARSSCVLVVEHGRLIGILTERDVVCLIANQCHLANLIIKEVMNSPVVTLQASAFTDLFTAINLLQQYHTRHIPVLDEQDQVLGLVTHESLRQTSCSIDLLRLRTVSEVMTNQVICAAPDSSMLAIAQLMAQNRVSSVIIVQNSDIQAQSLQIPVGIITQADIVQFQALDLNLKTCLADAVMSTPIFSVTPEDSLWAVQQIMEQHLVRRLAVTGSQGELLGIVTQTNVLQALKPLELYRLAEALKEKVLRLEAEKIKFLETRAIELEQEVVARTIAIQTQIEAQKLVAAIAIQIRSSLRLQTILETTVTQVRSLLGCDRVSIWRLNSHGEATTVVESTNSSPSLIGRQTKDACFSQTQVEMYRQGKIRVVPDIYTAPMSDCHRDMLIQLQTRAKILVPILCDQEVWGFLNATESQHPREWQESEVELLQQLSVQLAIAIQQSSNHEQLQAQLIERQQAKFLQKLVIGTASVTGEDFFPALVHHITETLNVQYALVTKLVGNQLHTLGFWANGALQPAISYDLAHTPCEYALREGEFYCQSQIQELFPDDLDLVTIQADSYLGIALKDDHGHAIGNLCILDVKPLQESVRREAIAILRVFAARAAAELQRQVANDILHDLNQDLEARVEQRTQELQVRKCQLRESQQFIQTVIDTIPLPLFWKNLASVFLGCNQQLANTLNLSSPQEIIGKTDFDLSLTPDQANTYRASDQLVIESGVAQLGMEEIFILPSGETRWIEAHKAPMRDESNNIIGVVGMFQDISDRKKAEINLQNSELRFRRMFDSNVVGMLFADFQGQVTGVNDRFLKMLGYTRDDFNAGAIDWLAMTPPEYLPSDFAAMGYLIQHGSIDPWEKEYYRKDGSRLPILIGAALLQDSDNQTICVIIDISEQKAALRQRQEAELVLEQQAIHKQLLFTITQAIRQSLDINVILNTTVQEVRRLLVVDRVVIYRFQPDWSGEFVTEAVVNGWSKLVGSDINSIWTDTYLQETQGGRFKNHETWAVNDIYQANLQPCHIQLLQQFQARAYAITSIFVGDSLWGLLGMYQNSEPYAWTAAEIALLEQIASQVAIAIYQANLYAQAQSELIIRQKAEAEIFRQLEQQRTLGTIVQKVRESLDIKDILSTVTADIKELLQSDRVIVFQLFADGQSQIVEEAVSSSLVSLKDRHWQDEVWSPEILNYYWQGQPRIVPDVMKDIWTDCLGKYSWEGQIQSKIVAPILQEVRDGDNNRWVAADKNNRLWGVLVVHACLEKRVWKDSEAQLLQQIANQLAIAIQQANLFDQLQTELAERLQAEAKLTEINQKLAITNEELSRATRLKDEFLANMSHELRTPLNAILGLTEVLQDDIIGTVNQRQLKALQTIERSGNHLLELINDILDVAKIEAGQIELDLAAISVGHLCRSSAAFIQQQALKKNIQLHINVEDNLPNLLVDERRIRQVLINLLNNAVKFTPEGGRITLEVSQVNLNINNPSLKIAVTDTGIGIAPGNVHKLFQPFNQIDSALNRQYTGTGLGLALVKRIVELHGGSVGLTSELGVGSCFTIELPCSSSSEIMVNYQSTTGSTIDTPEETTVANQAPLILLAEDNEANIIMFFSYLAARGYRVLVARDGQEAIDMAQTHQPNLILMDIQMPKMDGLAAMRQIRLDPTLIDTPIIALTALAMTGDRDRTLEAGANDYLTKPVKLKQLAITIQQLLN